LHHPAARQRAEAIVGKLTGAHLPPATTATLRERFLPWARPDQRRIVMRWCDWADAVLASPGPAVLVHGDLHGDNQVWDHDELRLVVDLETAGAAEPEYDLRTFPGPVDDLAARFSMLGIDPETPPAALSGSARRT